MDKNTNLKVWPKTYRKLKLISAIRGETMTKTLDDILIIEMDKETVKLVEEQNKED